MCRGWCEILWYDRQIRFPLGFIEWVGLMMCKCISAFSLVFLFTFSGASAQEDTSKFRVIFDENGNAILAPFDADPRKEAPSPTSPLTLEPSQRSDLVAGNKDIAFGKFEGYELTGPEGQTAVIAIPSGVSPARWVNPDFLYGLKQTGPDVLAVGLGRSAQQRAQEYLRLMAQAAYNEYCGSTVRPSEFTIEVSIGAEFVVNGTATVSAKFVSAEICPG